MYSKAYIFAQEVRSKILGFKRQGRQGYIIQRKENGAYTGFLYRCGSKLLSGGVARKKILGVKLKF